MINQSPDDKQLRNHGKYLIAFRQENDLVRFYEPNIFEDPLVTAERNHQSDLEQDNTPTRISFRL